MKHKEELDNYDLPLDIDVDAYNRSAECGNFRYYTARENGVLIGYATYFISRSLRANLLVALQDVFFLVAEHRKGLTGIKLLRFTEQQLMNDGIGMIQIVVPSDGALGQILSKIHYTPTDTVFTKEI